MNELEKSELKQSYKLLHQGSIALSRAERQGIRIDEEGLQNSKQELTEKIAQEEEKFYNTKFYKEWKESRDGQEPNYNSNPQLKEFLYKVKGYTPFKYTDTGKKEVKEQGYSDKGSTDEESLRELNIKALNHILYIRKLKKIRDTYIAQFEREIVRGYIHPFYNLHIARTYRSSSSYINSQNIPNRDPEGKKYVKGLVIPRPGHLLVEADYSSLEVVAGACTHKDPTMLSYLREGGDMHKDVCKQIFEIEDEDTHTDWFHYLRKATKNSFVFPQFYGDYFGNNAHSFCSWLKLPRKRFKPGQGIELEEGYTIADHLREIGIKTYQDLMDKLETIQDDFWSNRFPVYAKWREDKWEEYKQNGYITSLTGFMFQGAMRKNDTANYPIQSIAFHILLKSFILLNDLMVKEGWDSRLIGQVHDSIIMDVHPDEFDYVLEKVREVTTEWVPQMWKWIIAPLSIEFEVSEIDGNWSLMYEIVQNEEGRWVKNE